MQQNSHTPPRYSINDYNQWQGDWELIGGYPYAMSPSPIYKHRFVGKRFILAFENAFEKDRTSCDCSVCYELDWIINDETIVRPDLMVVRGPVNENDFIRNPPLLIVEIFSAAMRPKDRNLKFNLYQQCGVKYYLMADPDAKTIEAFELVDNRYAQMHGALQFRLTKNCTVSLEEERIFEA